MELPKLDVPLTFDFKQFNEMFVTDNYFAKGPRYDEKDYMKSIK